MVGSTDDPWLEATVSADGLNATNTTMQPVYESDGFHCSDLVINLRVSMA